MNKWYVVRVKFTKQLDNGAFKRVTEPYLVSAMSFTDAEASIYERLGEVIRGEFSVVGVTPKNYEDVFTYETADEYWWEVQVKMQDSNLDSDKIKMVTNTYLVSAETLPNAVDNITESLNGSVMDMTIVGVKSSPIVDIFPYTESTEVEEKELVEEN
jgi:hypothetical protein